MASRSLEALFLRARDHYAASGRWSHRAIVVLLLIHAALVTPWIDRELQRSSSQAEEQRFAGLPEIAALESAVSAALEASRSALQPALEKLAEDLQRDLDRLDATVRRLAAEAGDGDTADAEPPPIDPLLAPLEIDDAERLAAIRDALAEGAPGSSGSRYGLLAALDPIVEEQIALPRYVEVQRAWKEDGLPEVETLLGAAASALPGLRLRFPEAKSEWGAFEGTLSGLRNTVRNLEIQPPPEPFWWASPETARELEIGIPPATAEKIRRPLALDELIAAGDQARSRYGELAERLERERERSLAAAEAREQQDRSFAGLLAEIGLDLRAGVALFPLLLGIVLAAVMARRNLQLRELGVATRLMIEEGGSLALRDWCLAQLAGRLSDERSAEEAWRSGRWRALATLAAAWAWIAIAAWQVREMDNIDERRWLIVGLIGAAAILTATIHRLFVARGLVRLFVAGAADPISESLGETPVPRGDSAADDRARGEGESDVDSDLDAHTLR